MSNFFEAVNNHRSKFEDQLSLAMKKTTASSLPDGLLAKIQAQIERQKRFEATAKLMGFVFLTLISVTGFLLVGLSSSRIIIDSEAAKLLSLLFTDGSVIIGIWREYFLSVVESLPVGAILIVSILLLLFMYSVRGIILASAKFTNYAIRHF